MRVIPVNEAEAIFETYFGGVDSINPQTGESMLDAYTVTVSHPVLLKEKLADFSLTWHGAQVRFDKMIAPGCWLQIAPAGKICIAGYDIFRIFGAVDPALHINVRANIDGEERVLAEDVPGNATTGEIEMPVSGKELSDLRIRFTLTEDRLCHATLHWLGLGNAQKQAAMEAKESPYTPDWEGLLYPQERAVTYTPQLGILFDEAGLQEIRQKIQSGYLRQSFARLHELAQKDLSFEPEKQIGTFIAQPDRRWVRTRDMQKTSTSVLMIRLAFVGLVEKNEEMCRMAVRMALSAAHCTYWSESLMGQFPGNSWHHRSFTEEKYCRACALVLDWCGEFLMPYGVAAIEDAIIMKGLPRIESDFKRMEYIRSMNQGIVFSSGRIFGMLAVVQKYPRYGTLIAEAERDLHEMIEAYVLEDGGTSEGPAYWNYTFNTAMPIFYALSRFRKMSFTEYATPTLRKTGEYAKYAVSIQGDGCHTINCNDAHTSHFSGSLLAAYYVLTGDEDFKQMLGATLSGGAGAAEPNVELIIFAPNDLQGYDRYIRYGFSNLPVTGQTRLVRKCGERDVNLHLLSGTATGGHYHKDKGSFILETDKEGLCIDRGVTGYSHPETGIMQQACYHNLFYPELPSGRIALQLPTFAKVLEAQYENGVFVYATDTTDIWEEGLFASIRRRVVSPAADVYLFDDEAQLLQAMPMSFRVNTLCKAEVQKNGVRIYGAHTDVWVQPLWENAEVTVEQKGLNENCEPVQLIRLVSPAKTRHHVQTLVLLLEKNAPVPEKTPIQDIISAQNTLRVQCRANGRNVTVSYEAEHFTVQKTE